MLITPEYVAQNVLLHQTNPEYGTSGYNCAPDVIALINTYKVTEILDYGCGKATLAMSLMVNAPRLHSKIVIRNYDPAVPEYSQRPIPHEFVVCGDVLEHIEPECLDEVLADIKSLTRLFAYFIIGTRQAQKNLPDGRNAHLIIQPAEWWISKLEKEWNIWKAIPQKHCLKLVLAPS